MDAERVLPKMVSRKLAVVENSRQRLLIHAAAGPFEPADAELEWVKFDEAWYQQRIEVEWLAASFGGYREASRGGMRIEQQQVPLESIVGVSMFDLLPNMQRGDLRSSLAPGVFSVMLQCKGPSMEVFPPFHGPRTQVRPVAQLLAKKLGYELWEE